MIDFFFPKPLFARLTSLNETYIMRNNIFRKGEQYIISRYVTVAVAKALSPSGS